MTACRNSGARHASFEALAAGPERKLAELAHQPSPSAHHATVDREAHAEACAQRHHCRAGVASRRAEALLAKQRIVRIVVDHQRPAYGLHARAQERRVLDLRQVGGVGDGARVLAHGAR
ncbi:hypothetical protein GCM10025876_15410 [Demequina litorisediminis]|uniref:Uncharacterized protein n=1 Tax=Demequina litorisediminis TaxID=1849022 RepID=A0ABQ6IBX9_9MICO|nr:hypothetical protein GCM10025876_15410 [Demequina litorisediminis]